MKKQLNTKFVTLTLGKFIFISLLGMLALSITADFLIAPQLIGFSVLGISSVLFLNLIAFLEKYEPKTYFLLHSFGVLPTILFELYVITQLLIVEDNSFLLPITATYIFCVSLYVHISYKRKLSSSNLDTKIVKQYAAKKFDGNKVIEAYSDFQSKPQKASRLEKILPFIPVFNLLFVKYFRSYLGLLYIIGFLAFVTGTLIEFFKSLNNYLYISSALKKQNSSKEE